MDSSVLKASVISILIVVALNAVVWFVVTSPNTTDEVTTTTTQLNINIDISSKSWDNLLDYLKPLYEGACLKMYVEKYGTSINTQKAVCEVRENRAYLLDKYGNVLGSKLVLMPNTVDSGR